MKRRYLFVLVVIISSFVYSQKATTLKQLIQPKNIHKEAGKSEVQIFDLKGTLYGIGNKKNRKTLRRKRP
ncbi:MAG: hypothetical protein PVH61_26015 [Candidatus Aminicenantes bacterium]|jgi:hypothetical protein